MTPQQLYQIPARDFHHLSPSTGNPRKYDTRQLMAFRKLRLALGEQVFRETLVEGLDILSHSTGITNPAGWLYDFIRQEVPDGK